MKVLRFMYRNAADRVSERTLSQWTEVGLYIKGFSDGDGKVLTFRKDRIVEYLDGSHSSLVSPRVALPPKPSKEKHADDRPQILFTGFPNVQRAVLESKSDDAGLRVCQTVTKQLAYLCAGPNAGPTKVEKARQQNVYILSEAQLHPLLATGELPEHDETEY